MRIKRNVTITLEMDENDAKTLLEIVNNFDYQGQVHLEETVAKMIDSLEAVIPKLTANGIER